MFPFQHLVQATWFPITGKASVFAIFFIENNVSKKLPALKSSPYRLRRAFQIIFEFDEIPTGRVIIRRFMEQHWESFVTSRMKLHKFSFKDEAVWMLILGAFPLMVAILVTLWLIVFRGFDL